MQKYIENQVFNELKALRTFHENNAKKLQDKIFENEELAKLDADIRMLNFDISKMEFENKDISKKLIELQNLKITLSTKAKNFGINLDTVATNCTCPICKDTGKVNGKYCKCFAKRYKEIVKSLAGLDKIAPFKFEDCNLDLISNPTQKEYIKKIYDYAKKYCKNFTAQKTRNFLIFGETGTGKSCLSMAIANAIVDRGYTTKYITSFDLLKAMRESHMKGASGYTEEFEQCLNCEFLVIDDLGAEPIIKNVNSEYLYLLICEREKFNHSTLITSNLSDKLLQNYGDRVASRMTNKKHTIICTIKGTDLRNIK